MKVTEINIVFEDDNGGQHVRQYTSPRPVLLAVAASLLGHEVDLDSVGPPVLRKVTEVEGSHYIDFETNCIEKAGGGVQGEERNLTTMLPEELRAHHEGGNVDGHNGPRCRYRFIVEAIRVPDLETP